MANFQTYLKEIKSRIQETTVDEIRQKPPQVLIDVREGEENQEGYIPGSDWIPRGKLEQRIEDAVPDRSADIVLYCAGGNRSALAARTLGELGYTQVRSLAGGFGAWKKAGLPIDKPFIFTDAQKARYARHTMLPEVGEVGQAKLLRSRVLLVGAGGLGSPSGLYLGAAGIGTIGIVDDDVVDASNLQRQVLHNMSRIGVPKVDSAKQTLSDLNPDVQVIPHRVRLNSENVLDILNGYDLVVDGADNFQTRYLLNDAALMLKKPVVHASIFRFEGQLTSFVPYEGPCYRCLYPTPPPPELAPSCGAAGVLGLLPGIMGMLQSLEVFKLVTGAGTPLIGRLLLFEALGTEFTELKVRRDPDCPICGPNAPEVADEDLGKFPDYELFCAG